MPIAYSGKVYDRRQKQNTLKFMHGLFATIEQQERARVPHPSASKIQSCIVASLEAGCNRITCGTCDGSMNNHAPSRPAIDREL